MKSFESDPADDRYAYSRAALARLALSYQLRDLADLAADGVPTTTDDAAEPGEEVDFALALMALANEVLTRAVIYEREKGTTWETIGACFGITRQSAHEKFREAEQEWKLALVEPFYPSSGGRIRNLRLHEAAYRPTDAGRQLDEWARKHCDAEGYPVTGSLPALSLLDELDQVLAGIQHLYRDMHAPIDEAARIRLIERKAALLDRIAVEEGRPEAAEQAAEARQLAGQLRAGTGD
jgi:hypothetical protein